MKTPTATDAYDVIIVGARCAGAALAVRLARTGLAVVVLDSAPLASGQPNSTHLIQPPGMDELDALGVGDQVRELTPALQHVRMRFDDEAVDFSYTHGRPAHCLRRAPLDSRLQHAAAEAGAEIRAETRVVAIVRAADGRVTGVRTQQRDGPPGELSGRLVVGADGRTSTVAKLVAAPEYLGYDAPRACYWAYWSRSTSCDPHVLHNCFTRGDQRVVFPTDGDLLLIASAPPIDRGHIWRSNHTAAYLDDIRSYDPIASLLDTDEPVTEVRGVVKSRYYFRTSAGSGWALIGDAGHHKDFIIGLGISDALRDARLLSDTIVEHGLDGVTRYWRQRDVDRMAMFLWSRDLGAADDVNELERLVARRGPDTPEFRSRLGRVIDGELSPFRLVPPSSALRWTIAELVRGRGGALRDMIRTGAHEQRARRELARRQRLLEGVLADSARVQCRLAEEPSSAPLDHVPHFSNEGGRWSSASS